MISEQCADDKLILGGSHLNITMMAYMDHTILPKYQTMEIKKTPKTSRKSFDSIMMSGTVLRDQKNPNIDTKIV